MGGHRRTIGNAEIGITERRCGMGEARVCAAPTCPTPRIACGGMSCRRTSWNFQARLPDFPDSAVF